tara:strand:- start:364 stop:621 length:258 start_codon:yes stop_codon:yes gene_type:complete
MGAFIKAGLTLLPMILDAVTWVERFVNRRGKAKQDACVELVKSMVGIAEETTPLDLSDAEVDTATRRVIDAVVALQNLVSKKQTT